MSPTGPRSPGPPSPGSPPPGWYPVPGGAMRWWDGTAWTGHITPVPPRPPGDENSLAMLCHLGGAFASILVPIVIYATKKDQSPFIRHHAVEAINFHLTYLIAVVISLILLIVLIGLLLLLVSVGVFLVLTIVASVAAYRGEWYRYPLSIRFIR
ncbi:MAG: DUF4870 domain-containing protein [Acidimicrobiales bacterium]